MKKFSLYLVLAVACLMLFASNVLAGVTKDYQEAMKLRGSKEYEQSNVLLDAVIANPDAGLAFIGDAWYYKGHNFRALKNYTESNVAFQTVIDDYAGQVAENTLIRCYFTKGHNLRSQQKWAEAQAAFQLVVDTFGNSPTAIDQVYDADYYKILCLYSMKKYDEFITQAKDLMANPPAGLTNLTLPVNIQYYIALAYRAKKDYATALTEYQKLIDDVNASASQVYNGARYIAICYDNMKKKPEAIAAYIESLTTYFYPSWNGIKDSLRRISRSWMAVSDWNALGRVYVSVFFAAPQTQSEVKQLAADGICQAFEVVDGNTERVKLFADFQQYGSKGPDGVAGTEDDITNPLTGAFK